MFKRIGENITRAFNVNSSINSKCLQCKTCCSDENLQLTPHDILIISKELNIESQEFIEEYCGEFLDNQDFQQLVFKKNENGECIFKKDGECSLPQKPFNCKLHKYGFNDFLYSKGISVSNRNPSCDKKSWNTQKIQDILGVEEYLWYESYYYETKTNSTYIRLLNDDFDNDIECIIKNAILIMLFGKLQEAEKGTLLNLETGLYKINKFVTSMKIREDFIKDLLDVADKLNDDIKGLDDKQKEIKINKALEERINVLVMISLLGDNYCSIKDKDLVDNVSSFIDNIENEYNKKRVISDKYVFFSAFIVRKNKKLEYVAEFKDGDKDIERVGKSDCFEVDIDKRIYVYNDFRKFFLGELNREELIYTISSRIKNQLL